MSIHREGRDFVVVLEQCDADGTMRMLGERGEGIRSGDLLVTTRHGEERWRVGAIARSGASFAADLTPVTTALRLVASQDEAAIVPRPRIQAFLPPRSTAPFGR